MSKEFELQVRAADEARNRAMIEADYDALEKLLGDELVYTHSNAASDDKRGYMTNLRSGKVRYLSVRSDDVEVKVYGNAAIMHGKVVLHTRRDGTERHLHNAFMNVWVKGGGGWQMVAWASTPLPKA